MEWGVRMCRAGIATLKFRMVMMIRIPKVRYKLQER